MTEANTEEKTNGAEGETNPVAEVEQSNELTQLEANIIRQVEYYFGNMNLPRDKFLQEQISLDDGWVPFDIMLKFKRLANISSDPKAIADALLKSETGLIEVSDDKKKIRRSLEQPLPELNEERRLELQSRTVYVKGFPSDSTIETCLEFFKEYTPNDGIILRKYKDRSTSKWHFKGSVFVTFKTKEDAENFMNLDSVKYKGAETIRKWQKKYMEEKQAEFELRKNKDKKKASDNKTKTEEPQQTIVFSGGTVLHITDVTEKITKESIRDAISKLGGDVGYVDFQMGDKEGWIRLKVENSAKDVYEKCTDGKLTISNDEIACKMLEGDEEKQYLEQAANTLMKKLQSQKNSKHNKKFKGNKGRMHQGRKRKGGRNENEPEKKKGKA